MEKETAVETATCCGSGCCSGSTPQPTHETPSPEALKAIVREKYGAIAKSVAETSCCGMTPGAPKGLEYSFVGDDYSQLPGYQNEADLGLGCGLPTELADLHPGDTVVDLGSGAGNDAFIARRAVGDRGRVIGIDMTPEMVVRAKKNNHHLGYQNVDFMLGEIEQLPLADKTADVVVSNCVLNLVPDKHQAFREIFRILKSGGHFSVSDIVLKGTLPDRFRKTAELYVGCVAGAVTREEYLRHIEETGFVDVKVQKERPMKVPQNILLDLLGEDGVRELEASGAGAFSVTVWGKKP
jgi:SAM-dependent methyltransferase